MILIDDSRRILEQLFLRNPILYNLHNIGNKKNYSTEFTQQ